MSILNYAITLGLSLILLTVGGAQAQDAHDAGAKRCATLIEQYDRAAGSNVATPQAISRSRQFSINGRLQCQNGHWGEGAANLQQALRQIGQIPKK
jgi:hypothetical protein